MATEEEDAAPARRLPVGAEVASGGVHVRVWAPLRERVEVVFEEASEEWPVDFELTPEGDGYFSGLVPGAGAGALYRLRLDGGDAFPDPASRFQPQGPHGPSQVVDPADFRLDRRGLARRRPRRPGRLRDAHRHLHPGRDVGGGGARAAASWRSSGSRSLEVMPVAEFPGRFGWGYDGVCLFAPYHLYGAPDDFRRFVDRAHAARDRR